MLPRIGRRINQKGVVNGFLLTISPGATCYQGVAMVSPASGNTPNALRCEHAAQRPRAQLPGGSANIRPILAHPGRQVTLQLSARQPGQLQRVVRQHSVQVHLTFNLAAFESPFTVLTHSFASSLEWLRLLL